MLKSKHCHVEASMKLHMLHQQHEWFDKLWKEGQSVKKWCWILKPLLLGSRSISPIHMVNSLWGVVIREDTQVHEDRTVFVVVWTSCILFTNFMFVFLQINVHCSISCRDDLDFIYRFDVYSSPLWWPLRLN